MRRCSSGLASAGTASADLAAASSSNINSGLGENREGSAAKMRYENWKQWAWWAPKMAALQQSVMGWLQLEQLLRMLAHMC